MPPIPTSDAARWTRADIAELMAGIAPAALPAARRRLRDATAYAGFEGVFAAAEGLACACDAEKLQLHAFSRGMFADVLAYINRKAGGPPELFLPAGGAGRAFTAAPGRRPALLLDSLLLAYLERSPEVVSRIARSGVALVALRGWTAGLGYAAVRDRQAFRERLLQPAQAAGRPSPAGPSLDALGLSDAVIPLDLEPGGCAGAGWSIAGLLRRLNSRPVAPARLREALAGLSPVERRLARILIRNSHLIDLGRIGQAIVKMRDAIDALAAAQGVEARNVYLLLPPHSTSNQLIAFLYQTITGFPNHRIVPGLADLAPPGSGCARRLLVLLDDICYSGRHLKKLMGRLRGCRDAAAQAAPPELVAAPLFITEHGKAYLAEHGVPVVAAEVLPPFRSSRDYLRLSPREQALYSSFLEDRSPPVFVAFEYTSPDNNRGKWFNRVVAPLFTLRRAAIK